LSTEAFAPTSYGALVNQVQLSRINAAT